VTEDHERLTEDLAAYALGSLTDPDRTRVDAHLATCAACVTRLTEYQAIAAVLPSGLVPMAPPAETWATIRAAVRATHPGAPRRGSVNRRRRWILALRWPIVASVAASLLLWNIALERDLARYAQGPQVEKLARRPGRLVILRGTGQPQASARIFAAVDGSSGHMAISGLPALPSGRIYQLWFVLNNRPAASAATFTVDAGGRAWVVITVPAPLEATRAIIVTEAASPGSAMPTTPPLLEARDWR
jgi:anti-sigma factor RsiW